jgi:signal transduction histidine kinase
MGSLVPIRLAASWTWLQSVWGGRPLPQQFMLVALIALLSGLLLSAGLTVNGTKQVLIGLTVLAMVNLLLAIINGSREMVAVHRCTARAWDEEHAHLLEQKADLQRQIEESQQRLVEIHDRVLRRVGVELHDGPAQLIGLALLRLEGLLPAEPGPEEARFCTDFELIRAALQDALAEIRSMSAGLVLPDLTAFSPGDAIRLAARNHERRTATEVTCVVDASPEQLPEPIKACLYRFVQEGLNNAYRHGGGRGQTVLARYYDGTIEVEVADSGPGFEPGDTTAGKGLGLFGMSERIAAVGGTLAIDSSPAGGTRLTARFKMAN